MATAHGGTCHQRNAGHARAAMHRDANPVMPWETTGVHSAASRMPTTAASIEVNAARSESLVRQRPQKRRPAMMRRADGREIMIVAHRTPSQPPSTAPRKLAKVNSGPGTAWAAE